MAGKAKQNEMLSRLTTALGLALILIGSSLIILSAINSFRQKTTTGEIVIGDLTKEMIVVSEIPEKNTDQETESRPGRIDEGFTTTRQDAATALSAAKAEQTRLLIEQTQRWQATDYVAGDLGRGFYEVKLGDTLWELAEASYGDGFAWQRILEANRSEIGFLPNGEQALIRPGQIFII